MKKLLNLFPCIIFRLRIIILTLLVSVQFGYIINVKQHRIQTVHMTLKLNIRMVGLMIKSELLIRSVNSLVKRILK